MPSRTQTYYVSIVCNVAKSIPTMQVLSAGFLPLVLLFTPSHRDMCTSCASLVASLRPHRWQGNISGLGVNAGLPGLIP